MKMFLLLALVMPGLFLSNSNGEETPVGIPKGYKLLYSQDFSNHSALDDFVVADPDAWRISSLNGKPCFEVTKLSNYKPALRSPFNLAVVADRMFGDFVMDVELASTVAEVPGRDMCVCFGMQGPEQFYYAHIAAKADGKAHHNIFIVNEQPRTNIATMTTDGVRWGTTNDWHHVRIERNTTKGDIKVYFDDFTRPILVANDKKLIAGRIGFGSFDDTGRIRNIKVWGTAMETNKATFYRHINKTD